MALVASTAEAMKPPDADEHVQFLQAQFRKLLLRGRIVVVVGRLG